MTLASTVYGIAQVGFYNYLGVYMSFGTTSQVGAVKDYIMDYNEQHMDSQIQPTINYYRVYPSIIDENGECWYYLHFFTTNGENQDEYLKTKF